MKSAAERMGPRLRGDDDAGGRWINDAKVPRKRGSRVFFLLPALLLVTPALAQPKPPTAYDRAIAAGYKALTLCSGIFVAGRTQPQVEALELTGIYPEYDAIVPTLTAQVDAGRHMVEVPFDAALAPRQARWTSHAGCTIMPIGYPLGAQPVVSPAPPERAALADRLAWPMGESGAAAPGRTPARLAGSIVRAFDGATFGSGTRTTATVIVKNGKIVSEHYADGFDAHTAQRTWSVAKSITGTLIGQAVLVGAADVHRPTRLPQWASPTDPRQTITFDNLLRMASGLHSDTAGNRTDAIYFGGTAVRDEVVIWPLEAIPGTRFRYANNDILLAALAGRSHPDGQGVNVPRPPQLFAKIGMTRTVAEQDWRGDDVLSSQIWSTARDLARFGLLYLNDGVWNGERLLPTDWVNYVTTPSGPQPADRAMGYGATFWLLNNSSGVPADTYAAIGNRGQYVVIVPRRNIVIVRRGEDPAGKSFDIARFTAEVLAALE